MQPRNPLNILAAARAARNFGLGDIAVVDVQQRAWAEAVEKDTDRETPHGPRNTSRGWLGDARRYGTLMEAIGDCNWVLGTSSLDRRRVDADEVIDLRDLPARMATGCGLSLSDGLLETPRKAAGRNAYATRPRVAILFGSEKRGLTNEHLMHCQNVLWSPTADAMPSMNLGQAVAVVCYELERNGLSKVSWERPGNVLHVKPNAEHSEESAASVPADRAAESKDAKGSKDKENTKVSVDAEDAEASAGAVLSRESKEAANAAERQALVEQLVALARPSSASSKIEALGTRQRNLCKLINKLPLTHDDVRLLLGVVKDARTARTASSERPREPRKPRLP